MIQPLDSNATSAPAIKPEPKRKSGKEKSKFLRAGRKPFPNAQKVHIEGSRSDIRVAMREITQAPTRDFQGQMHDTPPLRVYDTSGPYTDPAAKIDIRAGLQPLSQT